MGAIFKLKIVGGGNRRYLLERDADRLQPLGTGHHFHVDALTLSKFVDSFPDEHGTMDENILAPLDRHETKSFLGIVPLDLTVDLLGRTGCAFERAIARRPPDWTRSTTWAGASARCLRGTCIDSGYLGDLWTLRPLTDPNRQRGARLQRIVPGSLDNANVQEGFAGSVRQFDEPESLFAIEPLNLGLTLRPGRHRT
jgi:hypothetical protein